MKSTKKTVCKAEATREKAESKDSAKVEKMEFGYYPKRLNFAVGDITVSTLSLITVAEMEFSSIGKAAAYLNEEYCECISHKWFYCPPRQYAEGKELPYSNRVFSLPMTHRLTHEKSEQVEHINFLVWCLGFFLGTRLTTSPNGFVDATPIYPCSAGSGPTLVDFLRSEESRKSALLAADKFWQENSDKELNIPRKNSDDAFRRPAGVIPEAFKGVIHSLFLSQKGGYGSLPYEQFIYLYTALDGCHFISKAMKGELPTSGTHSERIANLCEEFGMDPPKWAKDAVEIRNMTLHDGLFYNLPLGFGPLHREEQKQIQRMLFGMQYFATRFLYGILGVSSVTEHLCSDR